jgi:hypothetical protein
MYIRRDGSGQRLSFQTQQYQNQHLISSLTQNQTKTTPQGYLALARLLGELYNYRLVPHALVFEALHLLVDHGHEVPSQLKVRVLWVLASFASTHRHRSLLSSSIPAYVL